jgi:hypothetical protein
MGRGEAAADSVRAVSRAALTTGRRGRAHAAWRGLLDPEHATIEEFSQTPRQMAIQALRSRPVREALLRSIRFQPAAKREGQVRLVCTVPPHMDPAIATNLAEVAIRARVKRCERELEDDLRLLQAPQRSRVQTALQAAQLPAELPRPGEVLRAAGELWTERMLADPAAAAALTPRVAGLHWRKAAVQIAERTLERQGLTTNVDLALATVKELVRPYGVSPAALRSALTSPAANVTRISEALVAIANAADLPAALDSSGGLRPDIRSSLAFVSGVELVPAPPAFASIEPAVRESRISTQLAWHAGTAAGLSGPETVQALHLFSCAAAY